MMFREEDEASTPRNADNLHAITPDSGSNDVAKEPSERLTIEERLANKMFSYAREIICFFLAITFTALAALHSSPPKVSKPPLARPFFNQSSVVLDFYKGHLGAMIERVTDADFSFVMYYAPWDAESQAVREEFEKVAQYYQTQIFFAAINCWHPNSECRAQINKIQSYPLLILYPSTDFGIPYKGIRTFPYMSRFVNTVMNPIVRITHKEQLTELLIAHDAVLVGYFNFTGIDKTPGYKEFYRAALRTLERDPNRNIAFAIVTDAKSSESDYSVFNFPSANLLMWNAFLVSKPRDFHWHTRRYPGDSDWTSENIMNWVGTSIHPPVLWVQPPGIKSFTLAPYLWEWPVLFLFTPRNPLHSENYNYNLMKEIGLQYFDCANNTVVKNIIKQLEIRRHTAVVRHSEKTKECIKILKDNKSQLNQSTLSVSIQQWINDSCCANVVMNKCSLCKKKVATDTETHTSTCTLVSDKLGEVCKGADIFKIPIVGDDKDKYEFCCHKPPTSGNLQEGFQSKSLRNTASSLRGEHDWRSANMVKQAYLKQNCKRWLTGKKYHKPIFPRDFAEHSNVNLTESSCKVNKSLVFMAIDSLQYFHFAEALGIDVLKKTDKTAVVILDAAHESQYVMEEDYNRDTLVQFVNNFTRGFLQRTLRSNNSRRFAQKFKTTISCDTENTHGVCIPELTTETFLDTILDPIKDVVVFYHSPSCAFCSAISYVYLTVAHYLRKMDHLAFVRVDGDNNDLPWEYSMNRFPSILFFPAKRKEDSTVYPFSSPITIPNLINFILANLDGDSHVEALVNVCQSGAGEPLDKCIARTRWLCLDIIQELLQDYRKLMRHLSFLNRKTARNKRKVILLKLEHIRDIHLILGSTVNLKEDQDKVQLIRKKYRKYYRAVTLVELDSKVNVTQTSNIVSRRVGAPISNTIKSEL